MTEVFGKINEFRKLKLIWKINEVRKVNRSWKVHPDEVVK